MRPPFVVLDFPSPTSDGGGSLLFEHPRRVRTATTLSEIAPLMRALDDDVAQGLHAVGFVAYEAAPAFDSALAAHAPMALPLAWFGIFDAPRHVASGTHDSPRASPTAEWRVRIARDEYRSAIDRIRGAIGRGDVYQVNYTARLDVDARGDANALYRRLLAAQGPGFGAHIHTGRHEVLSASPELFFSRRGDRIVARPMKGTARRGRWRDEDEQRSSALASSPKERAENVMIVDLLRNDLSRVSRLGSVEVPRLFDVERRPTVLQMTSTVTGELKPGVSTLDLFTALFPCGSVTGAPKIAATQMIASLEHDARGVYCGAIGHIAPGGESTFSVAIRTLTIDHETGRAEYGVGGGITWDSADAAEYDEVLAKAAILTHDLPAFELLETLRLDGGRYTRLERHLSRLEASADYFGFPSAGRLRDAANDALAAHAKQTTAVPRQRVRVRVSPDGRATVDAEPLPDSAEPARLVTLASSPVRRANRFLYHKTTHRAVYDRHRAEHPDAFDVLLWNEERQLTEFTIGNVVAELAGTRVTPPRECGLLAGMFREELLERGEVAERVITIDDLPRVTRMWLVNSVREWVPVRLG